MTPISTLPARTIRTPPSAISPSRHTSISAIGPAPRSRYSLWHHIIWYLIVVNAGRRAEQEKNVAAGPGHRRKVPARPPKTGIGMLLREADAAFNRYLTAQLAVHGVT